MGVEKKSRAAGQLADISTELKKIIARNKELERSEALLKYKLTFQEQQLEDSRRQAVVQLGYTERQRLIRLSEEAKKSDLSHRAGGEARIKKASMPKISHMLKGLAHSMQEAVESRDRDNILQQEKLLRDQLEQFANLEQARLQQQAKRRAETEAEVVPRFGLQVEVSSDDRIRDSLESPTVKTQTSRAEFPRKAYDTQTHKQQVSSSPWGYKFLTADREPEAYYVKENTVRVLKKDSYEHPESLVLEVFLTPYLKVLKQGSGMPIVSAKPDGDSTLVELYYAYAEILQVGGLPMQFSVPAAVQPNIARAKERIIKFFNVDRPETAANRIINIYLRGKDDYLESYLVDKLGWQKNEISNNSVLSTISSSHGVYAAVHNPASIDNIPDIFVGRGCLEDFGLERENSRELFDGNISQYLLDNTNNNYGRVARTSR